MVNINSLLISDEYTGNQNGGTDPGLPWLQGSISDKMWNVVTFSVSWHTLACPMTFDATAQTITRTDCTFAGTGSFIGDGFQPGDNITITGTGGADDTTYNISTAAGSVTPTVIKVTGGITVSASYGSVNMYGDTPVTGVDFYDNMVGTFAPRTFTSLTDQGNTRKMSVDGITTSSGATSMAFVGASKASQNGTVSITGNGTTGHVQSFTITRQFSIVPFYKVDQLQYLKNALAGNSIPPDEWADVSCLGYIYQIDARYGKTKVVGQSSGVQSASVPYEFGNTGWFNEFLNGGTPEYSLISTTYTNHATSASMTSIDWALQTDVSIVLKSANAHFSNQVAPMPYVLGTPCVVNFMWLPGSAGEYQNQQTNHGQTFVHDRVFVNLGGSTLNGGQYGGNYQVLTNVKGIYNSTTQATITFTVNMSTFLKTFFAGKAPNDVNYAIWVTPQEASILTLFNTDRNAVLCDVNTMVTNTDNTSLLTYTTGGGTDVLFYGGNDVGVHPETDAKAMQGDWRYFEADWNVPVTAQVNDVTVRFQAVLYNTLIADKFANILSTADLDTWSVNTSSGFDGQATQVDAFESTSFFGPSTDPRAGKSLQMTGISGGNQQFVLKYGFQIGYQSWLPIVTSINEFVNVSTRLWSGYFTSSKFNQGQLPANTGVRTDILITQHVVDPATGIVTEFNRRCPFTPGDTGMQQLTVNTMTLSTQDSLGNDMGGIVASDQQTLIAVTINTGATPFPAPPAGYSNRYDLMIWYDDGTSQVLDVSSSGYALAATSGWIDQPTADLSVANAVTVSAMFDPSLLPNPIKSYRIICNVSYQKN